MHQNVFFRKNNKLFIFVSLLLLLMSIKTKPVLACDHGEQPGIQDQFIYFVMPDRFFNGNPYNDLGDYEPIGGVNPADDSEVLKHGFLKNNRAYYHGGDLRGIIEKLDYIKGLGVTTIWVTPVFHNKAVQGDGTIEGSSSGYHGYWIIDFLNVDPHMGTNQDLKDLINLAHAKGMKVILDIITNHTADVIQYAGDNLNPPYRYKNEYPFLDSNGNPFNDLDYAYSYRDGTPFPEINSNSFPYEVFIEQGEENIKNPEWLNNPIFYHNRGITTYSGEDSIYGDFVGSEGVNPLDDLFTAHPQVVGGMIDIYKSWIHEYRIDGFRIDTVKHVNIEFWEQFAPEIIEYAKRQGINDFYIFGEVYDGNPANLCRFTTEGKLPAVLDFGFQGAAASVFSAGGPTDSLKDLFIADDYYIDADSNAYYLPTFLGNHDMGRIGAMIYRDNPEETEEQLLVRMKLAYMLLFTARGVPTIYYGDEQGFTGVVPNDNGVLNINDQIARQDMFPTEVEEYKNEMWNNQIGTDTTPAEENFNIYHPLYKEINKLAKFRKIGKVFQKGTQIHRYSTNVSGGDVYAFSRILKGENIEHIVALNSNPSDDKVITIKTFHKNIPFIQIWPYYNWIDRKKMKTDPIIFSDANGNIKITVPAMNGVIYKAIFPLSNKNKNVPELTITTPSTDYESGKFWIGAELSYEEFVNVSFYINEPNTGWRFIGKDDNPPYRVQYNSNHLDIGSTIDIKAVVTTYNNKSKSTIRSGIKIENRIPEVEIYYENGNERSNLFAITSNGYYYFPQPVDSNESFIFNWREAQDGITLFYTHAEENEHTFQFDKPIYLDLKKDIYPNSYEDSTDGLKAIIYINNAHEISTQPNYISLPLPETLPYDLNAPSPIEIPIYVRGGMNGWAPVDELIYQGNYTYEGRTYLNSGDVEYKFADADWATYNFGAPITEKGITKGSNPGNLLMNVPAGEQGNYKVYFFNYPSLDDSQGQYGFYCFIKDTSVNYGPYGPVYLRGGNAISPVGWEATPDNLFVYNEDTQTLDFTANISSTSTDDGDWQFKIGTADWSIQLTGISNLWYAPENEVVNGIQYALGKDQETLWIQKNKGIYTFSIDVSDPENPVLTMVNHGPYGPIYLRGGNAISPSGWDANKNNLFVYDPILYTLNLTVNATSSSLNQEDWQFKIADFSWDFQLTGISNNWLDPLNKVEIGNTYTLGFGLQTLFIEPLQGIYNFRVDVSDTENPLLLITFD